MKVISVLAWLVFSACALILIVFLTRFILKSIFRYFMRILMTDLYKENLAELFTAVKRTGPQAILELNMRSEHGKIVYRPLGASRKFPDFSGLMFDVAQLHILPTETDTPVDTSVRIGPRAKKPLVLDTPLIVSGMAFGQALSAEAKIALAQGSAMAGTACNSGEGPFLQAERDNAKFWILQYNRGFWAKEPEIIRLADAVEIQVGQGSMAGFSHRLKAADIDERLQRAYPIAPGQDAVVRARHAGMQKPSDLFHLVAHVRELAADGVPVGIKMACSKDLELDLALALEAGVDYIDITGVQSGSHGSPASLQDNHGLPTIIALSRAVRFLEEHKAREKVSLIVGGGFTEPGDMLKALALGADAIYIGTGALFALSHTQVLKAMPWEPPTQLVWYNGKYAKRFDAKLGAVHLANYLKSCTMEIAAGIRVMGKASLAEVTRDDLYSLDETTAKITGIPLGFFPSPKTAVHRPRHFAYYSLKRQKQLHKEQQGSKPPTPSSPAPSSLTAKAKLKRPNPPRLRTEHRE